MKNYSLKLLGLWMAGVVLIIWLFGCTTEKKVTNYLRTHPAVSSKYCSETYPVRDSLIVRDSIHFDTLYQEGEPVVLRDSFFIKGDTVYKIVVKQCPQVQTVIKTVSHDSIIVRENTAKVAYQQTIIDNMQTEVNSRDQIITEQDAKIKTKNKWIWWLLLVCIGLGLWTVRKPLLSIIKL